MSDKPTRGNLAELVDELEKLKKLEEAAYRGVIEPGHLDIVHRCIETRLRALGFLEGK